MILSLQHNFEAGTHDPQSGIAFWITEDDFELLLLLPPTSGMWRLKVHSAVLGFMWYWGVESESPCMLC